MYLKGGINGVNGIYYDGYLATNLKLLLAKNKNDLDSVIIISGREGAGKSTMARNVGNFLTQVNGKPLSVDNVVFTPDEFLDAIERSEFYDVIIWDEAYDGLSTAFFQSKKQKAVLDIFHKVRQKRLYIIIVASVFFELNSYIATFRSDCLIHVFMNERYQKGFFRFFGYTKKKDLYIKGKQFKNYKAILPDFYGRFTKTELEGFDYEAYEKKKASSFSKDLEKYLKKANG